jgi:hypothetical protein
MTCLRRCGCATWQEDASRHRARCMQAPAPKQGMASVGSGHAFQCVPLRLYCSSPLANPSITPSVIAVHQLRWCPLYSGTMDTTRFSLGAMDWKLQSNQPQPTSLEATISPLRSFGVHRRHCLIRQEPNPNPALLRSFDSYPVLRFGTWRPDRRLPIFCKHMPMG